MADVGILLCTEWAAEKNLEEKHFILNSIKTGFVKKYSTNVQYIISVNIEIMWNVIIKVSWGGADMNSLSFLCNFSYWSKIIS